MVTRLALAPTAEAAPQPEPGTRVVVLDTSWTPGPGGRSDLVPLRPAVAAVLDREDLVDRAIDLVDAWAASLSLDERTTFRGVSWWPRRAAWTWLLAGLQWRAILEELLRDGGGSSIREIVVPPGEEALARAAATLGVERGFRVTVLSGDGGVGAGAGAGAGDGAGVPDAGGRVRWLLGGPGRRARRRELERRAATLVERAGRLADTGGAAGRLLVITVPLVHQRIGSGDAPFVDPFLGPVVDRLRGTPLEPVTIAIGLDRSSDAAWPTILADERLLAEAFLAPRWSTAEDEATAADAAEAIRRELDRVAPGTPTAPPGADAWTLSNTGTGALDQAAIGAGLLEVIRRDASGALPARIRKALRSERLLRELRPAGVLLYNEYGRLDWLAGARWAGVPVVAVQHGIIIPGHVGYRHARHPGLVLPATTCVFGPYEAGVLRDHGGYAPGEVVVTGSPRLAPTMEATPEQAIESGPAEPTAAAAADPPVRDDLRERDRIDVRRELGVADGDRLLVISTTRDPDLRRFHQAHSLARLLDGPLPGIHVVFKQHPAERDRGGFEALVAGLARAGGFTLPPVSVVRDVDLHRLLRAADAHLGLYSTVLTDAVAAGTPNLVALTQARADLLGYVAAGVGTPVRTHADLVAALQAPPVPDAAARRAFMDAHFLPGDGTARIADAVLAATATEARA